MSEEKKWTMRLVGPDDVEEFDGELDALRAANQMNTYILKHRLSDDRTIAIVEPLTTPKTD